MASWGNAANQQYLQDMDSNGNKLKVRNTSGAYTPSTFRVEIAERAHPLEAHDALKINGDVVLDYYGNDNQDHLAGSITVEPAGLFINGRGHPEVSGGDPDVCLGWSGTNPEHPGNRVYIGGMENAIGPGLSPSPGYAVTMKSPVKVAGEEELDAVAEIHGTVEARKVDALSFGNDHVLGLGRASATTVEIGHPGTTEHPELGETRIKGQFKAEQASDLQGDVLIRGSILAQSTLQVQNDTTVLGNLVADGNITAQGALSTVTAPRISAEAITATSGVNSRVLVTQDGLVCPGVAELKPEGCFHYVPASVRTDREESVALAVEQLTQNNSLAALHVVNNSMLAEGIGGYFRAPRAIVAEGQVQINGTAVLSGEGLVLLAEGDVQLNSRAVLNGSRCMRAPSACKANRSSWAAKAKVK